MAVIAEFKGKFDADFAVFVIVMYFRGNLLRVRVGCILQCC